MKVRQSGPVVWLAILGSTCLLLVWLQHLLWLVIPFLLGMILYYILVPLTYRLRLLGLGRGLAASISVLSFFALITLVAVFGLPGLAMSLGDSQSLFDHYMNGGISFVLNSLASLEQHFGFLRNAHLSAQAQLWIERDLAHTVSDRARELAVSLAGSIPSLLLAPFLCFFLLRDGTQFKRFLGHAVPNAFFEETLYLLHEVNQTARRYFQGLLKLTAIDTVLLSLGLWVIGLPSALLLGLVCAVLAWIPIVGSLAGCLLVVLVAAADFPTAPGVAYGAIVVFIVVRLLDDFVFMPLTLGKSLHMHPLLTVLMIFVGGELGGVAGLMLVLPILGVAMVIGESVGHILTNPRLRARYRHSRRLLEREASADLG